MAITAASIEANGWVLRLDVTGSLGSFVSYTLDPGGTPRVSLSSSHAGFVKSGGQAVAGAIVRTLIGTKPLRKPVNWNGTSLDAFVIDETDLGGGTIRVRIALSEHVYATDTGLSLAVLAGWRAGESAASGISVTNNSTTIAPIPIMRWVLLPYGVTAGSFTVALFVASHHPVGLEPVAGVKFTATDGSNIKTVWTTQLSTDTSLGDNLRCYTATIDPATATALTAGLLRCDAEVYPWLGAMRTTDAAGTKAMTNARIDSFNVDAATPWIIGYDPVGTRYGQQIVFVDPVNGTTTAAAGMVATTLAGAKAVAAASRAKDINTAIQAGYLANRTLAAANGQASQTRSVDGMQIVLAAGTHAVGSTAVTTGIATVEIPVRIIGDPADSDARNNCILPTGPSVIQRITRVMFQTMTAQVGINAFGAPTYTLIDNATVVGKAGSESSTTQPFSAAPAVGQWNLGLTRTKWWRTAAAFGSGNVRVGVYRKCETSRSVTSALVAVKNRLIPATEDSTVGTTAFGVFVAWASATLPGQVEDIVIAWNDIRSLRGRAVSFGYLPAATAGTPNQSIRRQAFIGNVCERIGTDPTPIYSIGEDVSATMSYNIIEGNTFVGDRTNTFYSDPVPTTVAETNSQLNQAFVNRVANNAFDWLPTKHDAFNDSSTASVRGNGNGYRPQMVEAWSMTYGVCHEANVDTQRATAAVPGLFALEYSGARTLTGYGGALAPLYSSDQSLLGTGTGGGNYRPQPASPLAGRALRGNADVDADGQTRRLPFAAGALQAVVVDLAPAGARSAQLAAASQANWSASLVPNRSRHALTGTTQVNWSAALIPVAARHGLGSFVGQGAQLSWAGAIAPGASRHACASGSASVAWTVTLAAMDAGSAHRAQLVDLAVDFTLAAVASAHASGSTMPGLITVGVAAIPVDGSFLPLGASSPLLLTGAAVPAAMLIVGPDPRTLIPNRN